MIMAGKHEITRADIVPMDKYAAERKERRRALVARLIRGARDQASRPPPFSFPSSPPPPSPPSPAASACAF